MNVAIVGCGLIGQKRAKSLGDHNLLIGADPIMARAEKLVKENGGRIATDSWEGAVTHKDVEIVVVSTTPDNLTKVALAAIEAGKHVLIDKPAARNHKELEPVIEAARRLNRKVRIGFNHRYHPAVMKAHEIAKSGEIGPIMFIRGRYGHGGRAGYDKEWRADPNIAGGGELLDQGMHLIDLSRWFLGDFSYIEGHIGTYFWNMPVEDNGFLLLKTKSEQVAWLHVSWTEWKNTFSYEIYGRHGKLQIDGLGGSYGVEQLAYYKMHPSMGPPETTIWQYPGPDQSWQREFNQFIDDIKLDREPSPNGNDALEALKIVGKIYDQQLVATGAVDRQ